MNLQRFYWMVLLLTVIISSCKQQGPNQNSAFSAKTKNDQMRHGWTIVTGVQRSLVDVNDSASLQRGKALFRKHCQKCHGPEGRGDGDYAKKQKLRPADLRALSQKAANHQLVFQIQHGRGEMPQWKDLLNSQETWDLSNFIQSLSSSSSIK